MHKVQSNLVDNFLSNSNSNIINFIDHKGYLDIGNPLCSDSYESTLNLLTRIASNFPLALTHPSIWDCDEKNSLGLVLSRLLNL